MRKFGLRGRFFGGRRRREFGCGKWMAVKPTRDSVRGEVGGRALGPDHLTKVPGESHRSTIVTWLILPVVICLSQRLSHACLSISNYTVKLRMAH